MSTCLSFFVFLMLQLKFFQIYTYFANLYEYLKFLIEASIQKAKHFFSARESEGGLYCSLWGNRIPF